MNKARQQAKARKAIAYCFFAFAALIALKLLFVGTDTSGSQTLAQAMGRKLGSLLSPIIWGFIGVLFWHCGKGKELEADSEEASKAHRKNID